MALFIHKEDVPNVSDDLIERAGKRVNLDVVPLKDYSKRELNSPRCIVQIFDRETGKEDYAKLLKEDDARLVDRIVERAAAYDKVEKIGFPDWYAKGPLRTSDYSNLNLMVLVDSKGQMSLSEAKYERTRLKEYINHYEVPPELPQKGTQLDAQLIGFCASLEQKYPNDYRVRELYAALHSPSSTLIKNLILGWGIDPNKPIVDDLSSLMIGEGYEKKRRFSSVDPVFFYKKGKPEVVFDVSTKEYIEENLKDAMLSSVMSYIFSKTDKNANARLGIH